MRKIYYTVLFVFMLGCTTATIPNYLPDIKPYTKRFYADYDVTLKTIIRSLEDLGWAIEKKANPIVYEQNIVDSPGKNQILIITNVRQTPMFLGTRYARINILLSSIDNISDIEIRYVTITALPFKSLRSYENKSAVERIFDHIKKSLEEAS